MSTALTRSIFWFRRDLRLEDNSGLFHALDKSNETICVFIFDENILNKLEEKTDKRVQFIHQELEKINLHLKKYHSALIVKYGDPEKIIPKLAKEQNVNAVFTNKDYEPYAINRDSQVAEHLKSNNIQFLAFKDQVIFEENEVVKDDGKPYTVFTPYSNKWKRKLSETSLDHFPSEKLLNKLSKIESNQFLSLEDIGFINSPVEYNLQLPSNDKLISYKTDRDFPNKDATSKLSVHLRFGTISIRKLAKLSKPLSEPWLNELIWRDFYKMILFHFPHVVKSAFKPNYDRIPWENNTDNFKRWCEGTTGIPIVDAGMRELNATGFMHNRVRMIVASFLTKNLLIDWRLGEAYFAKKLLDFDLSANNGGWQWAASSGCDAAPYFRVFNPLEQEKKFDPKREYIKKWIPEIETENYSKPIVDLKATREKAIYTYKKALSQLN